MDTTDSSGSSTKPPNLVDRNFAAAAPNRLSVCDFTYVATWLGFVYVAFGVDAFADRIVDWRMKTPKDTAPVLDALDRAIWRRLPNDGADGELIAHSDAGSPYLSFTYSTHLVDHDIAISVGSVGDAYDNALCETIIGLFKTEVIKRRGPRRNVDDVEYVVLEWVDWFNHRRLMSTLDYRPPAEVEDDHYRHTAPADSPAGLKPKALR